MDFDVLLTQVLALLQRQKRVAYRALKMRFQLDDAYLEAVKDELIYAQQVAADEDNRVLVWVGDAATTPPAPPAIAAHDIASTAVSVRVPLSYTPDHLTEKILTSRSALEGERKQVTVLFADIKDSTELIRDLDPEAAQQLLDPAIHIMMDAVHHFEGTVNQVLGDGIMALFGAPIAHEDHALRACYAALTLQAAMQPYTDQVRRAHGIEMQVRVGLNSGEVVVRTIGNDLHMDYSAVGPTTHLAARMEQLARPGSIRFPASTLRLVEGLVRVNALGFVPVKGMTEPVEVYELLGASTIRRRLQAAVARGLTRFVGRDMEIALLNQACEHAAAGHGQVVAAVGEAGVGKSRLMYEFIHSHRTQGWLVLESTSVSYGKATPYFPVVELLKRYVHLEDDDEQRTIRAKVTGQVVTLDAALQETVPALLALLDALPEDSAFLQLDPLQRRQHTLDALTRLWLRESQVQPLLLVFEDLHWLDTETQDLLDRLVESLPTVRLLLLLNYRPEYHHGWGSKAYYTQLWLDPLPPESADEFLHALLGDGGGVQHAASLHTLKRMLIARTEGNPFFLEESVRTLVETGVLVGEPGAYRLAKPPDSLEVPATVQAVLAARIDRLSAEAKHLLQIAAVIGTEVPLPLLQAIAERPAEALQRDLSRLQEAAFLYETSLFPERVYTFKHALTHDVAYSSLLQERRRALHARIVEALEALYPERLADHVEPLAHHAVRGAVWEKALVYCQQAATRAAARSAYREAVECLEQALEALQHLPESRDLLIQAIELRLALRNALMPLGDFGSIFEHLHSAERLAETLGDQLRLGEVCTYLVQYFTRQGDHRQALASGQRALALVEACGDHTRQVAVNHFLCTVYQAMGDHRNAMAFARRNLAALHDARPYERFGLTGFPAVFAHTCMAWSLAEEGAFAEAIAYGQEGVSIATDVNQPFSLVGAYFCLGFAYMRLGALPQAISQLERALSICQAEHILVHFPIIASNLGYAYALCGRITEALPLLEQAVERAASLSIVGYQALWMAHLGVGYLLAGRLEDAVPPATQAVALARQCGERGHEAWSLWCLGKIAARRHPRDVEPAATHYRQALALAEALGMRPLQAHCYLGLGTLDAATDQRQQARTALCTAMALYHEMEMTFWLPEAEAALAELEAL